MAHKVMIPFGYVEMYSIEWVMAEKVHSVVEACWDPMGLRSTIIFFFLHPVHNIAFLRQCFGIVWFPMSQEEVWSWPPHHTEPMIHKKCLYFCEEIDGVCWDIYDGSNLGCPGCSYSWIGGTFVSLSLVPVSAHR